MYSTLRVPLLLPYVTAARETRLHIEGKRQKTGQIGKSMFFIGLVRRRAKQNRDVTI